MSRYTDDDKYLKILFCQDIKKSEALSKIRVKCSCGHSLHIKSDYKICNYCGKKVYSKKEDFSIKLKEAIKKVESKEEK